ncbi:BON domain-containing protein [Kingella negevensis]|uniref:BON domain-containing protein n=1 Tax=Kingella negevensis TaxID=1522312 RepID=UPI00050A1FEB|nr:BON domain-containing protein [Kingella negevensis]MDK4688930.1 BON domain-containing protein [Kingella negevensis]WII92015.1 BON domain-containing protein [Kingella negevensis]
MKQLPKNLKVLTLAIVAASGLGACTTAAVATTATVAGVGSATDFAVDRRSMGSKIDDEALELRIKSNASSLVKQANSASTTTFSVISYNHNVLLMGQAANDNEYALIERAAHSEPAVKQVYNYVQVLPAKRTLANINADTWITSKVRARLLGLSLKVYPGHVKVATFNGTTYVLGLLTPEQQATVTEIVRTTSGVQRVVTLYENYSSGSDNKISY